jgi:hypothetical protein
VVEGRRVVISGTHSIESPWLPGRKRHAREVAACLSTAAPAPGRLSDTALLFYPGECPCDDSRPARLLIERNDGSGATRQNSIDWRRPTAPPSRLTHANMYVGREATRGGVTWSMLPSQRVEPVASRKASTATTRRFCSPAGPEWRFAAGNVEHPRSGAVRPRASTQCFAAVFRARHSCSPMRNELASLARPDEAASFRDRERAAPTGCRRRCCGLS